MYVRMLLRETATAHGVLLILRTAKWLVRQTVWHCFNVMALNEEDKIIYAFASRYILYVDCWRECIPSIGSQYQLYNM